MQLGQLLKQARLEAGLSQRQLCANVITRNMLSQIENGTARPSMETLRYLAGRLGKPVSYFLNEPAVSPGQELVAKARTAFLAGDRAGALDILSGYDEDGTSDAEAYLLKTLCCLALAETAIAQKRMPYAQALLQKADEARQKTPYCTLELHRRQLLLLAQVHPEEIEQIPGKLDDGELILRGLAALEKGDLVPAAVFLDSAAEQQSERWNILRGDVYFAAGEYTPAAQCYLVAEESCLSRLERCYEKLGDYQKAYYYACRQRSD